MQSIAFRFLIFVSFLLPLTPLTFDARTTVASEKQPPNIIFVLADDLGWSELGCYGNEFNETPCLDRMAKAGIRFQQAYAAAPVCSPYRGAFLTGMHPVDFGILDYLRPKSANGLSTQFSTLPQLLAKRGYSTGMIGKWHLTGYKYHEAEHEIFPRDHGFQFDFAREIKSVGNGANFWPYVFRKQPVRWVDIQSNKFGREEFIVDRMNDEALQFIERNQKKPFFLYLSHYATHTILNGKPNFVAKYRKKHRPGKSTRDKSYISEDQGLKGDALNHWAGDHNPHLAAMLESVDDGVGLIRKKLRELGLARNTILIFTSDNGGETNVTSNAPLRGGKSQLYEGGIRVPLIIEWPKKIKPNTISNKPTITQDFLPTLCDVAEIQINKDKFDGKSIVGSFTGSTVHQESEREFYWHYPLEKPHFLGGRSAGAIRKGKWKLIQFFDNNQIELYDLSQDIGETKNLAIIQKEIAKELLQKLTAWRRTKNALIPAAPKLTDPRQLYFADHFSPKQTSARWKMGQHWMVTDGVLKSKVNRPDAAKVSTIALKDVGFGNALIRFDLELDENAKLRLVTKTENNKQSVFYFDKSKISLSYDQSKTESKSTPKTESAVRKKSVSIEMFDQIILMQTSDAESIFVEHPSFNAKHSKLEIESTGNVTLDNFQIFEVGRHREFDANLSKLKK